MTGRDGGTDGQAWPLSRSWAGEGESPLDSGGGIADIRKARSRTEVYPMSMSNHLDALKGRHSGLEDAVRADDQRPMPDPDTIHRLKVEKLKLKDEIDRLTTHGR